MKRNWESSTTIQKKLKTTLTESREGVKGIKKKKEGPEYLMEERMKGD